MMKELGAILREERESQGLSLEEVRETTHINLRYLTAIENGDFSQLPGEVYRRGFLRSFAEAVGADPGDILARYEELRAAEKTREEADKPRERQRRDKGDGKGPQAGPTAEELVRQRSAVKGRWSSGSGRRARNAGGARQEAQAAGGGRAVGQTGVRPWVRGGRGRGGAESRNPAGTGLRVWGVMLVSVLVLGGAFGVARWTGDGTDGSHDTRTARIGKAIEKQPPRPGTQLKSSENAGATDTPVDDGKSKVDISLTPLPDGSGPKPAPQGLPREATQAQGAEAKAGTPSGQMAAVAAQPDRDLAAKAESLADASVPAAASAVPAMTAPVQAAVVKEPRDTGKQQEGQREGERVIRVDTKGSEGLVVSATAVQRTWFEVRADGKLIVSRTLSQGEKAEWKAARELRVRVGNAPGARLTVNGIGVGDLGFEALTLVFLKNQPKEQPSVKPKPEAKEKTQEAPAKPGEPAPASVPQAPASAPPTLTPPGNALVPGETGDVADAGETAQTGGASPER